MTTVADALTPGRRGEPLSEGELAAARTVAVMVGALGVLGFVNSFRAVARAAVGSFGELAPTVPLGIDLAIAVFSALDLVLARLDMRPWWVRLVPWSLTGATIYLNVAGQATWFGRIAHAVFPALWVVAVTLAAHVIRIRAQLAAGTRLDRIRISRWLLAPLSTARMARRMVLWEICSYPDALDRERLLALTDLQDTFGTLVWRWKAPRRTRALYRLGELAPGGPVRSPDRTDDRTDPYPDSPDDGRTPAPPAVDRDAIIAELADQIRDAIEAGERWQPDYPALIARTGYRRSWCEKVVRDARAVAFRTAVTAPARTEAPPSDPNGPARTGRPALHAVDGTAG
jgi:hypothetical protein